MEYLQGHHLESMISAEEGTSDGSHTILTGLHVYSKASRETTKMRCNILFLCDRPDADPFIFSAVNECGLVYDGRLVVNEGYRTIDPKIFAGGPLAKFTRSFRKGSCHDGHSSRVRNHCMRPFQYNCPNARFLMQEIGSCMAKSLKREVLGEVMLEEAGASQLVKPRAYTMDIPGIIVFGQWCTPILTLHASSGGLRYFCIRSPKTSANKACKDMLTGPLSPDLRLFGRYCALSIDSMGWITDMVFLGMDKLDARTYLPIVGMRNTPLYCDLCPTSSCLKVYRRPISELQ